MTILTIQPGMAVIGQLPPRYACIVAPLQYRPAPIAVSKHLLSHRVRAPPPLLTLLRGGSDWAGQQGPHWMLIAVLRHPTFSQGLLTEQLLLDETDRRFSRPRPHP